ncbi:hypothetical protein [Thiolinea disciformis]|uniref:hypothetical protein n=1 Tax=Thiolinea disciformis TaxID=125614 RepID=UPI0003A25A2D|nr:hypothetical protein [Thiolinea disciformis]
MPSKPNSSSTCPLCKRSTPITFHHLIPRKLHRRTHFRKHYTKDILNQGIDICRACHNGIHKLYDEMHLGKHLNTLETLQADEALAAHFAWVARQKINLS